MKKGVTGTVDQSMLVTKKSVLICDNQQTAAAGSCQYYSFYISFILAEV